MSDMSDSRKQHRALYKRTSISRDPEEARRRRVAINESLRKKHREQLITAKRFRHLTRREEQESAGESDAEDDAANIHDADIDPYYRLSAAQVEELARDLRSGEKTVRLEALEYLGKFLLEPAQALIDYITQGDCIATLTRMLSSHDPDEIIQSAKVISNIAAGPYSLWIKSVSTVPYLIGLLNSDNVTLRDIAAGAIGNMAAEDLGDMTTEDDEVRATIRKNGAVLPLIRMLDTKDSRMVQSACFALANLARASENELREFLDAGIYDKLVQHLTNHTADTTTEVCWVMSYLSANSKTFRKELLQDKSLTPLVKSLKQLSVDGAIVLPVLRTLGNIAGDSDDAIDKLLNQPGFLATVVKLTQGEHRAVKKEALWVLSNITASERYQVIEQVENAGAAPLLINLVTHGGFDIRKGAAYCLMNMALHGEKFLFSMPHEQVLPGFLALVRSQDAELIRLGLTYVDLLLNRVPQGKAIMGNTPDSTEALAAVAPAPDPELYALANKLVDQYYEGAPEEEMAE
ncbi:armadillo-type protein [Radiomyces spectabilis]|uniref:armadillo-type protein n=1 Tax=Radiomyces spectabilis TaxID=64574 RepID=UPI00221EE668|nr:armadillo-type protein [Radiomyces spectabilis]KAI8373036.1 armadillo-type protein [Radiomyces spectabilis]